jgi:hypothetical protein
VLLYFHVNQYYCTSYLQSRVGLAKEQTAAWYHVPFRNAAIIALALRRLCLDLVTADDDRL